MSVSGLGGGVERLAEVFVDGIEVDVFDGQLVAVGAIEFSPPLGLSDVDPVGCPVAGSSEAIAFNERLQ